VANAVGAITGAVTVMVEATITPDDDVYLAHTPTERRAFDTLERAKAWTSACLLALLEEKIAQAELQKFDLHRAVECVDHQGASTVGNIFLECRMRATAVGRPEFAGHPAAVSA
jgi:hypothetical protein